MEPISKRVEFHWDLFPEMKRIYDEWISKQRIHSKTVRGQSSVVNLNINIELLRRARKHYEKSPTALTFRYQGNPGDLLEWRAMLQGRWAHYMIAKGTASGHVDAWKILDMDGIRWFIRQQPLFYYESHHKTDNSDGTAFIDIPFSILRPEIIVGTSEVCVDPRKWP